MNNKMHLKEGLLINTESLPFSVRLWTATSVQIPFKGPREVKSFGTREYKYKKYYKYISRRG